MVTKNALTRFLALLAELVLRLLDWQEKRDKQLNGPERAAAGVQLRDPVSLDAGFELERRRLKKAREQLRLRIAARRGRDEDK